MSSCCVKGCRQAARLTCQRACVHFCVCEFLCQCVLQCEQCTYARVVARQGDGSGVWSPVVSMSSTWCSINLHPKPFCALLLQHDHPFMIPTMATLAVNKSNSPSIALKSPQQFFSLDWVEPAQPTIPQFVLAWAGPDPVARGSSGLPFTAVRALLSCALLSNGMKVSVPEAQVTPACL